MGPHELPFFYPEEDPAGVEPPAVISGHDGFLQYFSLCPSRIPLIVEAHSLKSGVAFCFPSLFSLQTC